MTEKELRTELQRLLEATASIEDSLALRRELWQLVGDPKTHNALKDYGERVARISEKFHEARRAAITRVRQSGLYGNYVPLFLEVLRGMYSLLCLRVAGVLYAAHIVAVVDVRHHQSVIAESIQRLPAFA